MNTNVDKMPLDNSRFDRLVDGELSETQRAELLAGLDHEPGGWRRCALAFLEAQCWKQELSAIAERGGQAAIAPGVIAARPARWISRLGTPLAVAASFLLALWLGAALQRARVGHLVAPTGTTTIADVAPTAGSRTVVSPPDSSPWRVVNVSAPPGSQSAGMSFEVPAVERETVDP